MSVAWVGVGVAAAGALSQASAAGDAADQQSESAAAATMAQQQAAAQMRQDLSPWTQAGGAAQNRLNQFLGIGGAGGGVTSMGLQTGLSPDQVRQQLMSRYTKNSTTGGGPAPLPGATGFSNTLTGQRQYANGEEAIQALGPLGAFQYFQNQAHTPGAPANTTRIYGNGDTGYSGIGEPSIMGPQSTSEVDYEGLDAAIAKYYEEQNAQNAAAQSDPQYGSLLRAFHNGEEFDSGPAFSFEGKDLATDPGYQFGLNQGTQGIERGQASRGNFLSGAAMKELSRYNEDYAGTKFNEAFNRASSTYGTNLNRRQNEWNTNLNAYNSNRNSIYDFLTGVSRTGQNSAAQVGTANNQAATNSGNNMMAAGNAQAAGTVASSNALQSGANQALNQYNSTNNLNSAAGWNNLLSRQGGGYSGYTGYTGGSNDPIANLNTQNGWTG